MKLGILGTGKIVREFLPWLAEHTPFTVQAICSTERSAELAQSLCGQYGVPQHTTNFLELLQWVDVVYIAVPNLQHVRYARVALEAGKHVIVEKPLAPTAAQTEELVNLARHKKVFLFEAITTQYLENYAKIRELLPRIGTVKLVQCNFSQYSSRYDAFCAGDVQPAFDPACAGGALMDLGVYNVSYIVGLFGEPNQVKYTANDIVIQYIFFACGHKSFEKMSFRISHFSNIESHQFYTLSFLRCKSKEIHDAVQDIREFNFR